MIDLKNPYVIASLVGAAAIIGVGIYMYFTKYKGKTQMLEEEQKMVNEVVAPKEGPTFVLFYATWCPHCENMMGDWDKAQSFLQDKIDIRKIESADPEIKNHQIPGFPTLRMFPRGIQNSGEYVDYKGPRKTDSIVSFVMNGPEQ